MQSRAGDLRRSRPSSECGDRPFARMERRPSSRRSVTSVGRASLPLADVYAGPYSYTVVFEPPGLSTEDIALSISGRSIMLSAERGGSRLRRNAEAGPC